MNIQEYLNRKIELINAWIDELIQPRAGDPREIWEAIRYAILAGGKRIRPILMLAVGETFDRDPSIYRHSAVAIECIHTYSLIHDDLPCMDNDLLRRGKPTCHVVFGEALAVLAGDALQTLAFELISSCPFLLSKPETAIQVTGTLARRAGIGGMIGGQVLDIRYTAKHVDREEVLKIHERKTAALIQAALEIGALIADVDEETFSRLSRFGYELGLAFQIVDDILDVTQPSEKLGKTAGKDDIQEKPTLPRAVGLEKARELAHFYTQKARTTIQPIDHHGLLTALADFILTREY